jgi:2,3-dihydroxy-p-cumate/2,3-dihydroxybenzoate 3,4-dioxygenase
MEEFPEANPRAPRRLDPLPLSVDSWGSVRDPRMTAVGEIASYEIVSAGNPHQERQPA